MSRGFSSSPSSNFKFPRILRSATTRSQELIPDPYRYRWVSLLDEHFPGRRAFFERACGTAGFVPVDVTRPTRCLCCLLLWRWALARESFRAMRRSFHTRLAFLFLSHPPCLSAHCFCFLKIRRPRRKRRLLRRHRRPARRDWGGRDSGNLESLFNGPVGLICSLYLEEAGLVWIYAVWRSGLENFLDPCGCAFADGGDALARWGPIVQGDVVRMLLRW
jgi:hypothetical protein